MPFSIRPYRRLPLAYILGFASLITLLVLSSEPAYAEWVQIDKTGDGMTTYADPDTIRRKGDLVKVWQLSDFKTIQTVGTQSHLSFKRQSEYDCIEERTRTLAITFFSGNMGHGNVVINNSDEARWVPVAPGSVGQALWEYACEKK